MVPKEDVVVVITKEGYIKRVSQRSYAASDEDTTLKDKDYYAKDENEVFSLINPEELNVEDIANYY